MNTFDEMLNDLFAIKAGKRNNKDDQMMVQKIHDHTVEMGVHDMMKIGARFSASDKEMMKKIHGYSIDMGAVCDAQEEMKIAKREDVNPESGQSKYGDVQFADATNKKYPIDNERHIRAAWNYINKEKNANKYSAEDLANIKKKILAAWRKIIGKDAPGMKSINLQQMVDDVRTEFYDQFNKPMPSYSNCWVMEVYDDHVIAQMGEEIYQINYTEADGEIEFDPQDKWQKVEKEYVPVKAETMVAFGSEVKSYDGDKIGGYLVRFSNASNADISGDYFTKETDFGFTKSITSPIYLHHCLPVKTSDGTKRITKAIGEATLSIDGEGVAIDGKLYEWIVKSADEYTAKIAKTVKKAIKAGKMGWSSGTAPHLIEREKTGNAFHIKKWPLGLDSTITPTPAGIKQGVNVLELKSVTEIDIDDSEVKAEGSDASALANQDGNKTNQQTNKQKGYTPMEKQEKDALVGEVVTSVMTAIKTQQDADKLEKEKQEKMEADRKKEIAEGVKAALKDPETLKELGLKSGKPKNAGGVAGANLNLTTQPGDSAEKAFIYYIKTGDPSGIRTGEAYDAMKTDYAMLESTQYQGQEAVPTEVVKTIVEKRDQISVARAAGAVVYPAGSNAAVVPIEKAGAQVFGITTINNSNTFTTQTSQPLDKLSATIYMFTYNVPIDINLIDDSVFNVEGWMSRRVGRGWGLTENKYYLMGTNSGQPQGAIYSSTLGVTSASASALTPSEVIDQFYKVPGEYRDNVVWVMAGATEGVVRKLTSSTFPFIGTGGNSGGVGQGGGTNSLAAGTGWLVDPKSRVYNSSECEALGSSGKKVIFTGNFEAGYAIIERKGLTVLRDPYSAANKGMVNLWWYFRQGGGIVNADALYHLLTP